MSFPELPLLLTLVLPFPGGNATTSQRPETLAAMRDQYRPLLIFAPEASQQSAAQRHLLFPHRAELLERNVMLVFFFHKYAGFWDSTIATNSVQEEATLRRRFHIHPNEFTVILLGKDGGEKFRSNRPITIDQLNGIIDAMPMRQQEMRSRHTP